MTVRVILVGGHNQVREALSLLLEGEPDICVAGAVEDGGDVGRQARQLRPDVAVLDYSMLETGGLEAVRQITGNSPDTRVLILSLCTSDEHQRRASEVGVTGWLLKESVASEIATAIRTVARGESYYPQPLEVSAQ